MSTGSRQFQCTAAEPTVPAAAPAPDPAGTPRSYPLVCRGGGDMRVLWSGTGEFRIAFRKAARARQPGPSECAWLDRPLNPAEPSQLAFAGQRLERIEFAGDGRVTSYQVPDRGMQTVLQAVRQGGEFFVHAHTRGDSLVVTRFGP